MNKLLYNIIFGSLALVVGFVLGTISDLTFFFIYNKLDPSQKSITKLIAVTFVQIAILMVLLNISKPFFQDEVGTVFNTGLISSQIFMMNYTVNRLGNLIYARNTGMPPPKPIPSLFRFNPQ